jgi:RNA polymerase sigma factor (sigma-70 family)
MPAHHPPELSAEHRLAFHKLFEAVFGFAWKALDRYGLSQADRDDIAQNVAIAALRRWPTYRESCGTPGQWLWGIVRNEHRVFLRAQGRQPLLAGAELHDVPSGGATPEESASLHDLADHLLSVLPIEERRVVVLYEVVGLTYREIGALEGISKSEAHDRHHAGMLALAAAVERGEGRKLRGVALPIALADLSGGDLGAEPPPALREDAWRRAAVALGLDPAKESVPPEGGLRRGEPSFARDGAALPSTRPPRAGWAWVRRLAPTILALISGLTAAPALQRCAHPPEEALASAPASGVASAAAFAGASSPSVTMGAPPPSPPAEGPTMGAPPPNPRAEGWRGKPTHAPAPATSATAIPALEAAPVVDADNAAAVSEQAAMDAVRTALRSKEPAQALDAIAAYARRFPQAQYAPSRERLRGEACAMLRSDAGTATTDERCAGQ